MTKLNSFADLRSAMATKAQQPASANSTSPFKAQLDEAAKRVEVAKAKAKANPPASRPLTEEAKMVRNARKAREAKRQPSIDHNSGHQEAAPSNGPIILFGQPLATSTATFTNNGYVQRRGRTKDNRLVVEIIKPAKGPKAFGLVSDELDTDTVYPASYYAAELGFDKGKLTDLSLDDDYIDGLMERYQQRCDEEDDRLFEEDAAEEALEADPVLYMRDGSGMIQIIELAQAGMRDFEGKPCGDEDDIHVPPTQMATFRTLGTTPSCFMEMPVDLPKERKRTLGQTERTSVKPSSSLSHLYL